MNPGLLALNHITLFLRCSKRWYKKTLKVSGNSKERALVIGRLHCRTHFLIHPSNCWILTLCWVLSSVLAIPRYIWYKEHHTVEGLLLKNSGVLLGSCPTHHIGRGLSSFIELLSLDGGWRGMLAYPASFWASKQQEVTLKGTRAPHWPHRRGPSFPRE